MKRLNGLLLAGLLGCLGCTSDSQEKLRDGSAPKRTASKPASDGVPASVSKLLPPDQVNANNASAQAQLLSEDLRREKNQLDKSASAKAD
jgi:hypothetical protein